MKRGDTTTLSVVIGLIIAVIMLGAVIGIGWQYFEKQSVVKDDFVNLIEDIESLEDGQSTITLQRVYNSNSIVTFQPYEDIKKGKKCFEFYKPTICPEDQPCVCLCSWGVAGKSSTSCEDGICAVPTLNYDVNFYGEDCNVQIDGNKQGVVEIYLERREDNLAMCTEEGCLPDFPETTKQQFLAFMDTYRNCLAHEDDDCLCSFSNDLIPAETLIKFLNEKAYFLDLETGLILESYEIQKPKLYSLQERKSLYIISDGEKYYTIEDYFKQSLLFEYELINFFYKNEDNIYFVEKNAFENELLETPLCSNIEKTEQLI